LTKSLILVKVRLHAVEHLSAREGKAHGCNA
jgi:hypothetical protein